MGSHVHYMLSPTKLQDSFLATIETAEAGVRDSASQEGREYLAITSRPFARAWRRNTMGQQQRESVIKPRPLVAPVREKSRAT